MRTAHASIERSRASTAHAFSRGPLTSEEGGVIELVERHGPPTPSRWELQMGDAADEVAALAVRLQK